MRGLIYAAVLAVSAAGSADAAVLTRSFNVTANQFMNFAGQPAPFQTFSADITVTYDNTKNGFFGAPDYFRVITDGQVNAAPFSTAPIAGYFGPNDFVRTGRIGVGGAINGGNVSLPGTDDFYIVLDVDTIGSGSVSFATASQTGAFLSAGAVVRETTASAPIPEPGTWMLLLAGVGVVGVAIRRARPALAPA